VGRACLADLAAFLCADRQPDFLEFSSRNSVWWKDGTVNAQHQEHRYDAPQFIEFELK
jgi:hypothetical protein